MQFLYVLTCALTLCCATVSAAAADPIPNNPRLVELFQQDQGDRKGYPKTALPHKQIAVRDEQRREEVLALLSRAEIRTAQDYFYAALIFHHGQNNDHYRLATSLAWIAATLEPTNKDYLWLSASSWDRMMLKRGKPQWYGAQERRNEQGKQQGFEPIDETAVSDEERARFQVKSLAQHREQPDQPARVQAAESEEKPKQ
jgi:hypothetical protein